MEQLPTLTAFFCCIIFVTATRDKRSEAFSGQEASINHITVRQGNNITLLCPFFRGHSKLRTYWRRDGVHLFAGTVKLGKYPRYHLINLFDLQITSASLEDRGTFSCTKGKLPLVFYVVDVRGARENIANNNLATVGFLGDPVPVDASKTTWGLP